MYESLIDALRRGAAAEALSAARDAVAANPNDAMAHRLLGAALHLSGDRATALQAVDAALELAPDDAVAHLFRAGLLLDARQIKDAQAALAQSVEMDPNQFPAYIMQGNLALGRGDLDEAERIARVAARIAPGHPHLAVIEGMVALRRGDADRALSTLSQAAEAAPEDMMVHNALGFAFLAKQYWAFAEQSFRRVLQKQPGSVPVRLIVANLLRRQKRYVEAADEAALLVSPEATPDLLCTIGEIEMDARRPQRALEVLKPAFARAPRDRRLLAVLAAAWQHSGEIEDARRTLEEALATMPDNDAIWHARLAFEPYAGPEALAIVERWQQLRPDYIPALLARAAIHDHAGEIDEADAIAYQVVALEPGHSQAELRIVDSLLKRDPAAAVARVEGLIGRAMDRRVRRDLRRLLGRCLDIAGDAARAATVWAELAQELAPERLSCPPLSTTPPELPPLAAVPEEARRVLLLWGAPGAQAGKIGVALGGTPVRFLADRFSPQPPTDAFQRYATVRELESRQLDGEAVVAQWRETMAKRAAGNYPVCDWLVWWDNALLPALRAHLPEATLLVGLRDPRDMLLDWLAWDAIPPFAMQSPVLAAEWLARALEQIADLHERDLFPHALIRLDGIETDPNALAARVGEALGLEVAPAPADVLGIGHFAPGHWRAYAEPLAAAFAALTPVAVRLGYPET